MKDKRRRRKRRKGAVVHYVQDSWHVGFRSQRRAKRASTAIGRFRIDQATRTIYVPPKIISWFDENLSARWSVRRGINHLIWLFELESDAIAFRMFIDSLCADPLLSIYYKTLLGHSDN